MSTTLNGTTGITFPDGSTQATTAPYGMVNRLINGAMAIDQRSDGAAKSCPAATDTYTLDRWVVRPTGNAVSVQRTTSGLSTGCQDALQITGAASVTAVVLSQRIESYNIEDLIGQTVTVSVTMANSLLTSIGWAARYANSVDNFSAMTAISSGSITVNSTMTTYTFSFVVPVNGANGISIELSAGAQTSGTWKVTQVQLQKGSTATSFDYRPYGTELALCQRYYQSFQAAGTGSRQSTEGNGLLVTPFSYVCTMRASPSCNSILNSGSADGENQSQFYPGQYGWSFARISQTAAVFSAYLPSGIGTTANIPWRCQFNASLSAEL